MLKTTEKIVTLSIFFVAFAASYSRQDVEEEENPEEMGGYFEGDIILTEQQIAKLNSRNGLLNVNNRWPNRLVPYEIFSGHFSKIENIK